VEVELTTGTGALADERTGMKTQVVEVIREESTTGAEYRAWSP
jgi:hypothetical protein